MADALLIYFNIVDFLTSFVAVSAKPIHQYLHNFYIGMTLLHEAFQDRALLANPNLSDNLGVRSA